MISMQFFLGVLTALAVLAGAAIAFSAAVLAAAPAAKPGRPPHGGIRRDLPPLPQPHTDDARTLVLR